MYLKFIYINESYSIYQVKPDYTQCRCIYFSKGVYPKHGTWRNIELCAAYKINCNVLTEEEAFLELI